MAQARRENEQRVKQGWLSFAEESALLSRMNRERGIRSLYGSGSEIPEIYRHLSMEHFIEIAGDDPGKRAGILVARQLVANGKVELGGAVFPSVLLWGPAGVGKTGLLTPVFQAMSAGRTSLWISLLDLTQAINAGYKTDQAYQRISAAREVDILFLDDMGDPRREQATDGMRTALQAIVWHRHANKLPTLMTSNLSPSAMKVHFSDAIYQRIATMALVVEMKGRVLRNL